MTIKRQEPLPAILNAADLSNPALANPAVARCCRIWQAVFRAELDRGELRVLAARSAGEASCGAMPPLTGEQTIRDFIACVAHGIQLVWLERDPPFSSRKISPFSSKLLQRSPSSVPKDESSHKNLLRRCSFHATDQGLEDFLILQQSLFELAAIRVRNFIHQYLMVALQDF